MNKRKPRPMSKAQQAERRKELQQQKLDHAWEIARATKQYPRAPWYVVSYEDIIDLACTYAEAREKAMASLLEARKEPDIKRVSPGLYRYEQSPRAQTSRRKTYYIGTQQALVDAGFDLNQLGF